MHRQSKRFTELDYPLRTLGKRFEDLQLMSGHQNLRDLKANQSTQKWLGRDWCIDFLLFKSRVHTENPLSCPLRKKCSHTLTIGLISFAEMIRECFFFRSPALK